MTSTALNFTGRDFTTEYERLITLLREQLPEYTDLNHSDVGMVLLALCARETDHLNYFIDRAAQEGFLRTLVFKQSVIELGRLVDYLPTLASPASTTLRLSRATGVTGHISIPVYSMFTRSDGLPYTTIADVSISSSASNTTAIALQGVVTEEVVATTSFSNNEWSGQRRYRLPLNTVGALFQMWEQDEVAVYWTQVDTFWGKGPEDKVFILELVGDDAVDLVVGDGTFGSSLEGIDTVYLKYLVTSGLEGNCGTGIVTIPPNSLVSSVTCSNVEIATGGGPAEDLESIRTSIPAVTRIQRRGVTVTDYETLISHIPGVSSCQVLDRNIDDAWPHLHVAIYVNPNGGGDISTYLRSLITQECMDKGHLGTWPGRYTISSATRVPVDIQATVGLSINTNQITINEQIVANLGALLDPSVQEIGGSLYFNDVFNAITSVSGVSNVDTVYPIVNIMADNGCILVLGTISLTYR
jgi:hypothetical protein